MLAGGHCTCADAPCVDVIDGYYNKGVCPYRQGNSGIKGGRSRMHVGGDEKLYGNQVYLALPSGVHLRPSKSA